MKSYSFGEYIWVLLGQLSSKVTFLNMKTLFERVLEYSSINLFKISRDKKEFKKLRRTITGENKHSDFNSDKIIDDAPMLLITNKKIHNPYDAYQIYDRYLKRSRIEGVFKFMKEAMGWEEFRLKDFNGIKALVAVGFFVASYLYEITKKEVYDDFVVLVAEAGGAENGKVTRHYILEGIKAILTKYRVDQVFNRNKPDEETMNSIHDMVGYDGR